MSRIEKVLCVIDPTVSSQPALTRAMWLSKQAGARLELLICYYNQFLSGHTIFDSRSLKKARAETIELHEKRLEDLAEPGRTLGLDVITTAVWDHPLCDGIVRHVCRSEPDMVFKDTHRHEGFGLTSLSNTDWDLIRTCPAPLWLVKPHDFPKQPAVIASVDPTHDHDKPAALDEEILNISKYVADIAGGEVHAFHSVEEMKEIAPLVFGPYLHAAWAPDELEKQIREHHQSKFEEIAKRHDIAKQRTHLATGYTHDELPTLASKLDAALVVMGAVGRTRLQRIFIGSTAEQTLNRLPCDLLIVKPDWFETPVHQEVQDAA